MLNSLDQTPRSPNPVVVRLLLGPLLLSGTVVACNCEDTSFAPLADYEPENVLQFGDVSVNSEKSLPLQVRSAGTAGLVIEAANLANADDTKWTIEISPDLQTPQGLAPGRTSTITVTYRPCPDAWDGDAIKDNFDFNTCPGEPDSADLNITDNTVQGTARISLSAQPVQPPVASVRCVAGGSACGMNPDSLSQCNALAFGQVLFDGEPCDLVVELQNSWRNDKPVDALAIEKIEVIVQEINEGVNMSGEEVGFTPLDMNDNPLAVDSGNPFLVPIEAGGTDGAQRFKLRYTGALTGTWRGSAQTDTGLRIFTNDPDQPVITVSISAIGAAPGIAVTPPTINFGPVEQNSTATSTLTVLSVGTADLQIATITSDTPEFTIATDQGSTSAITLMSGGSMRVFVTYAPVDTGADTGKIIFATNDPMNPTVEIDVRGGAQPQLRVEPPDTLVFPLPNPVPPPPAPPRTQPLTLSNVGFGDLEIMRVDITGPDGDRTHPSANDFSVMGCASYPCDINITLCPPNLMGCVMPSQAITVVYQNDDISMTDLAELTISSNDESIPEYTIVLSAQDVPCLFPTAIITVQTNPVCTGQMTTVDAMGSNPGGMAGQSVLTDYEWVWQFAQGQVPPALIPPDGETTNFTASDQGVHILGLRVKNDCGAWSSVATETILVSGNCN